MTQSESIFFDQMRQKAYGVRILAVLSPCQPQALTVRSLILYGLDTQLIPNSERFYAIPAIAQIIKNPKLLVQLLQIFQ